MTPDPGLLPTPPAADSALLPYVPRLVADWATSQAREPSRVIDATMVFADISGFTAMSERLARLGRSGAEEVTEIIGACFEELLGVAYEAGGGLLKFGGDALLLAFVGDDHPARATFAADAMRARLRTAGRITSSAGAVTLRMSVGVHSGAFDCFLVGHPTRELLLVGPAPSAAVAMEHAASAGQIVLSPTTLSALPERCRGTPIGGGYLLRGHAVPTTPMSAPAGDASYEVDLGGYVPTAVREHVLAGGGAPEHRNAAIAFVHFGGLDERIARDGNRETALALETLVSEVESACSAHDVALLATDVDADGGKFLLAAGVPTARGEDEARMLATARRIVAADQPIPVRVGVHRGPVFAGDVGPRYRRTFTVMGDTVNLAARLMAAASPGQVLASGEVVDRAPAFATAALPLLQVKGKRRPVQAYSVEGTRRSSSGPQRHAILDLPFVGRNDEIERLQALAAQVRSGRGAGLQIVGPAGIGKTRLIDEVCLRIPDLRCVRVTCEAYEAATPFAAVRRLLGVVLAVSDESSPDAVRSAVTELSRAEAPELEPWLPLVMSAMDVPDTDTAETATLAPQYRAQKTTEAIAGLLAAGLRAPVLCVIEDTEWMDDASHEVVGALQELLDDRGIGLIRTSMRSRGPGEPSVIELHPLDPADVRRALQQATEDAPLRPHELDKLTERADGNPLFLSELWRMFRGRSEHAELPDNIEALVTAQIDRLPAALRQVLSIAAVLGRTFDRYELKALAPHGVTIDDDLWPALGEFVELEGPRRVRFRHGLLRDAAYARLPFRRRRELHLEVAWSIESSLPGDAESEAELLSLHFFEAQAFAEAWQYARVAGDRARQQHAFAEAAVFFERALAAGRRLAELNATEMAAVHEALGEAYDRNGEYERARVQFRSARRLVRGDAVAEAGLFLKEAWIPERIGRNADSIRLIRRGWRLIEDLDGQPAAAGRAQLAAWYAGIRQGQGRHHEAIKWCERAIREARVADDRDAEAHALYLLDWAYTDLGQPERATNAARALQLFEELGDLSGQGLVLNGQGASAYWMGEWADAVDLYERAHAAYTKAGSEVDAARSAANIAEVLSDQGHYEPAGERLVDALRVARAAAYHDDIALMTGFLGRIAARRGRYDDARLHFEEARRAYHDAGLPGEVARIDAWRAEALLASGDAEAALALADEALGPARAEQGVSPEIPLLERVRAVALARLQDPVNGRSALDTSLSAARTRQADYDVALALHALVTTESLTGPDDDLDAARLERDEILRRLVVTPVALG
jgi:predicted ATPase/class 3 adenylate cyclase